MPRRTLTALALVLLALPLAAHADSLAVPDPKLTPGAVASSDFNEVCGRQPDGKTYSQDHRQTSLAMKHEVFMRYHFTGVFHGEVDHLVSLCLGGADDVRNLWPQPAGQFQIKDKLEAHLCKLVCSGKVPLTEAQEDIRKDWRAAYRKYFGVDP